MLKLLGRSHGHILPRSSIHNARSFTSLTKFRKRLQNLLENDPAYDLRSIFKRIKNDVRETTEPSKLYEAAFDVLIRKKRLEDGATIMLDMQKHGLQASNATQAKMLALSLTMDLPPQVGIENVVNNICDIVAHKSYTEADLIELVRLLELYDVDRGIIGIIVNHFLESRGKGYKPSLRIVPEVVEALARDGKVDQALTTLEEVPLSEIPGRMKSLSITYTLLLTALRDTSPWDNQLAERILRGISERQLSKELPLKLLLAWAARREKYLSVLHLFNEIQTEFALDMHVYRTLFEMHTTFTFPHTLPHFAPLAPRKLFHDMGLLSEKPNTYVLTTALTGFMHRRDYIGALGVLDSFAHFGVPLDNATFYNVIKPLTHRMWGDIASKRRMRDGQIKWGDRFLGAKFTRIVLSPSLISDYLDQVSRERYSLMDPLYVPGPMRARGVRAEIPEKMPSPEEKEQERKAKWGAVAYPVPSMEAMETVDPDLVVDPDVVYDATPLMRLVRRAAFAQNMIDGELDERRAAEMVQEMERRTREEMIPEMVEQVTREHVEGMGGEGPAAIPCRKMAASVG
ncbi:hypothetical protein BDN70DRAFT_895701 [Pholiota conissans]|uniref:Uncharacterized protein n=1 Tax=Pholiota conissans TaxID=109636 RepID=A0A9P5YZN0_9AGAR|nr:hypothetical protein BDN70DRAFT_895701 [Pholiota conissans]